MNTEDKQMVEFLKNFASSLHGRLGHLSQIVEFNLRNEVRTEITEKNQPPFSGIYGKKLLARDWQKKIDNIILLGASEADLMSVLCPENKGQEYDRFLMASINFVISGQLTGKMDFIREYCGPARMKEYVIIQYNIKYLGYRKRDRRYKDLSYRLCEIAANWEISSNVAALTIMDIERNLLLFLQTRKMDIEEEYFS